MTESLVASDLEGPVLAITSPQATSFVSPSPCVGIIVTGRAAVGRDCEFAVSYLSNYPWNRCIHTAAALDSLVDLDTADIIGKRAAKIIVLAVGQGHALGMAGTVTAFGNPRGESDDGEAVLNGKLTVGGGSSFDGSTRHAEGENEAVDEGRGDTHCDGGLDHKVVFSGGAG